MFIKEVVLCGFKSYKETTTIENFSPGYNVIVGRNGSGKSNFFAALEFALRPETKALNREERNTLLFHGQVSNHVAYVEVVFDNADRKLPYNTDTVVFRRVIGAKKDRFYVNKKESHNIKQFLDSAGITNPYYIVKQGKINEMATATEKMRLQVLYDISGSKVFDEKKAQTHKMLEECHKKLLTVDKLVESIDQHLETMEELSKELQKYLKLEKKKRAVEYLVHSKEKNTIASKIDNLQEKHNELMVSCEPVHQHLRELYSKIDHIEGQMTSLEHQVVYLGSKKEDIELEMPLISSRIAVAENKLKDTVDSYKLSLQSENNINKIVKGLISAKKGLKRLSEDITETKNQEAILVDDYTLCKTNMEKFKEKCGRTAQFSSKSERDSWISTEISKLKLNVNSQNSLLKSHNDCFSKIKDDIKVLTQQLKDTTEEYERHREELNSLKMESSTLGSSYHLLLEKRSILWNDSNKMDQKLNATKDNITRFTDLLRKNGGNGAVTGWKSLQSILSDLRQDRSLAQILKGYYGLVLENFQCHESRNVAVEVTAGGKLLYHIVESHEVSKILMAEFNRRKLTGEVNFISIAEIKADDRNYPENKDEGTPLIKEITFKNNVLKVMKYIFGGTLLCSSLELATQNSKRFNINCVTSDGDKVLRSGPLTGGYHNRRMSKIEVHNQLKAELTNFEQLSSEKPAKAAELLLVEKEIVGNAKVKEKIETTTCAIRSAFDKLQLQKDVYERKLNHNKLQLVQEERKIETLNNSTKNLNLRIANLEEELAEGMSAKSSQYAQKINRFRQDIARKMESAETITSTRKEKEDELKKLEKSILKMEKEIEDLKLLGNSATALDKVKGDLEMQLSNLSEAKRKLDREWNDISLDHSVHQKKISALKLEKDKFLEGISRKKAEMDNITKKIQQIVAKQSDCRKTLGEVNGTILKLGTIPSDIKVYEEKSTKELCRELKKISKALRSLGKVNRKATEKLERAMKVKEELLEEKEKYKEINARICELDKTLDDKKGDAVFKVFETIHQQFREIFLKLVPQGNIRMFLRTKNGGQVNAGAVVEGEGGEAILSLFRENKFEGLAIDVNFMGKNLRGVRDIRSLSGGQKSVISLALLLAIQRCDPVPLYIFDEVDQALDHKYRSAVASVVKELSQNAQFICTTFSRQFIDKSDAAFGVFFRNQASKIMPISKDVALSFVKNESSASSAEDTLDSESCAGSQTSVKDVGDSRGNTSTAMEQVIQSVVSVSDEDMETD